MKKTLYTLFAFIWIATTASFAQDQDDKLQIRAFGIAKPIYTVEAESIEGHSHDSDHSLWGIAFETMTYHRLNVESSFAYGFCHGSSVDLIFPEKFEFSPYEGMFISPQFIVDVIKLGVGFKIGINDDLFVVANAGIAPTVGMGFSIYNNSDVDIQSFSYNFGFGVSPHIQGRLVISNDFSVGLGLRMGHITSRSYTTIDGDDLIKSDKMDQEITTLYLMVSF